MAGIKSRNPPHRGNSLRIIAGEWRGRRLSFPDLAGLRPTGDRIRETLFNWLSPAIQGARCLDLFAGSGALGLEAASRGATLVTLIDSSKKVCHTLEQHCATLGAGPRVEIVHADATAWLRESPPEPYDIVFLDPPFDSPLLASAIQALQRPGLLSSSALVYLESPRNGDPVATGNWHMLRSLVAGNVDCQLLETSGG